jgi:hypothetical protein
MENSTPPIGDPKATATPAALAAVIISRILPKDSQAYSSKTAMSNHTYSDFVKTSQTGQQLVIQCNTRRVRMVLLFLRRARKQSQGASTHKNHF